MKSLLPTLTVVCLLGAPAAAQEKPSSPTLAPAIGSQLQDLLGGALKPASPAAPTASTRFKPSGKSIFVEDMLAKLSLDDQQKAQFRQYAVEVTKLVETAYEQNGFQKYDLGVALGGLLETAWEMDQGTFKLGAADKAKEEANKKQTLAVVRQIQQALGGAAGFKTLSDRDRQMAYEGCTFLMGHLAVTWQQAGQDAAKLKEVRQIARQQLTDLFRIDPDRITRSATGELVARPGAAPETPRETGKGSSTGKTPAVGAAPADAGALGKITRGGEIQPGIYAGIQTYGKDNEVRARYRLYLYPNGQYRIFNEKGKQLNSVVRLGYEYDPRSGLLDLESGIQYNMKNDRRDPDDDLCVYGRDKAGKPFVLARSNRGFGYATTLLTYAGPLDQPSPEEEAAAKADAEAEAKRYKWVVPAGQGLKPSQIAGVLFHQDVKQFYNGSGLSVSVDYDVNLLLQDGTVYNGLPVAPDEMDVSRSRRQEPEKWGKWKRQGDGFVAAWPDAPGQFKSLKGKLTKPGGKDLKLSGRFGSGETSGSVLGSSYRLWGVTFGPDGRFVKDERGGYGSNNTGLGSGLPSIHSTYDDKGSATSATGENFVVASGKKKPLRNDRSGSYSIDGYVMTLKFDDGRVTRLPFFFRNPEQKSLWFEGALLEFDEKKPGEK